MMISVLPFFLFKELFSDSNHMNLIVSVLCVRARVCMCVACVYVFEKHMTVDT